MPQENCPAAIPFKAQLVQDFFPVFSLLYSCLKIFPKLAYRLTAAEASYWYDHSIFGSLSSF